MKQGNKLTFMLFSVYMLLLTGIILFKLPFYSPELSDGTRVINIIPFKGSFDADGNFILSEVIQNILIFIPFGIYICMLEDEWSFKKKAFAVIGLTLIFELIQFIFAMGRTDITDILGNTLGGISGIGIYALFRRILKKRTITAVNFLALFVTIYVVWNFTKLFYLSHFVMRKMS